LLAVLLKTVGGRKMKIRKFVRKVRGLLKLTVEEFADQIGAKPRNIYRWESGERTPSGGYVITIFELCKERGIDLDDLVSFFSFVQMVIVLLKSWDTITVK
jgi:transcriptional regulator with XRE-family HTH domain